MKKYAKYLLIALVAVLLYTFFIREQGDRNEHAPRDYAEIIQSGILRAVTEYNSISFHAEGDTVAGFHYELVNAFARSKGLRPEITPEMSFANSLKGVQEGKYDILANSVAVTSASKDSLLFTQPILLNKQVLVQRKPQTDKDSAAYVHSQLELAGKTLHLVKGSPAIFRIHNLGNEIGDTIYVNEVEKYGQEQLLAMVAYGDIDYAVCDESIAEASLADFPQLDIKTAVSFSQFYSWGVSKHSPVLLDSLNAWLDSYIHTAEFHALYKKYYKH